MRALFGFGAVVALVMTLAGCGVASSNDTDAGSAPSTTPTVFARPARVHIPALHVDANVIDLGLQPDGTMQVPPDAKDAGWYVNSPLPGQKGPSILAAHVNWKGVDGPFAHLDQLKPGDEVLVESESGAEIRFVVSGVKTVPKDRFPTDEIYGDTPGPELKMITCGGVLDTSAHSYKSNVIASAQATP